MNNETQKKEEDWITPTKKLLADINFLKNIREYDKDNIAPALIEKIQPYIAHENCNSGHLKSINQVAASLVSWVLAMDKYYRVSLIVKPKQAALEVAEKEYAELSAALKEKQANLRIIQNKVQKLRDELQATQDEKTNLQARVADCQ